MSNNKSLLHTIIESQFLRDKLIVSQILLALVANTIIAIRTVTVVRPTTLLLEFRYSNLSGGGGLLNPASWAMGLSFILFAVIVTTIFIIIANKFFNLERYELARTVLFLLLILLSLDVAVNQAYLATLR